MLNLIALKWTLNHLQKGGSIVGPFALWCLFLPTASATAISPVYDHSQEARSRFSEEIVLPEFPNQQFNRAKENNRVSSQNKSDAFCLVNTKSEGKCIALYLSQNNDNANQSIKIAQKKKSSSESKSSKKEEESSSGSNNESSGHVVINEVLFNQSGKTKAENDEFIEIFNATNSPVNISGWKVGDGNLVRVIQMGLAVLLVVRIAQRMCFQMERCSLVENMLLYGSDQNLLVIKHLTPHFKLG